MSIRQNVSLILEQLCASQVCLGYHCIKACLMILHDAVECQREQFLNFWPNLHSSGRWRLITLLVLHLDSYSFSSVLEMGNSSGKMRFLIASENLYFFYESLISKVLAVNSAIMIKVWILWSKFRVEAIFRSIHQTCSIKRVVPKNFIIFTGKHLCWSLFFK